MRKIRRHRHRHFASFSFLVLVFAAAISLGCAATGLPGPGAWVGGLGLVVSALLMALGGATTLSGCDCGSHGGYEEETGKCLTYCTYYGCLDTDIDVDTDTDTDTDTDDVCLDVCLDVDTDTDDICLDIAPDAGPDASPDAGPEDGGFDAGWPCVTGPIDAGGHAGRTPQQRRETTLARLEAEGTLPPGIAQRVRGLRRRKA